jgi:transcriptional regulator with XRE-family HTH domain
LSDSGIPDVRDFLREFGVWTESERQKQRLSMTECARRAGISVPRWKQIEIGQSRRKDGGSSRPEESTVFKVADALHVPRSAALETAGYVIRSNGPVNMDAVRYLDRLAQQVAEEEKGRFWRLVTHHAEMVAQELQAA